MNKSEIYYLICSTRKLKNFTFGKKYFLHMINGRYIKIMNDKKEWVIYEGINPMCFMLKLTQVIFKKDIGSYSKNQKTGVWISINKERFVLGNRRTGDCKQYLKILEE